MKKSFSIIAGLLCMFWISEASDIIGNIFRKNKCDSVVQKKYEWGTESIHFLNCKMDTCMFQIRKSGVRIETCNQDTMRIHVDGFNRFNENDFIVDSQVVDINESKLIFKKTGKTVIQYKDSMFFYVHYLGNDVIPSILLNSYNDSIFLHGN